MKKHYLIFGIAAILFSCTKTEKSKKEEVKDAKEVEVVEQVPTTPEETEAWDPVPPVVTFNENKAPSDAIILFDGTNFDAWENAKEGGGDVGWTINGDGTATIVPGSGNIKTKEKFGCIQLHIEWSASDEVAEEPQKRSNSGVFLQNRYEIQILDSYNSHDNPTYSNGQAASVYKQHIPLVNAMTSPMEWQVYDIIFHAPEFDEEGNKTKSGALTLLHNGVLVHNHVEIKGTTEHSGPPRNIAHGDDVILIQDHNDGANFVSFRNIWLRKL